MVAPPKRAKSWHTRSKTLDVATPNYNLPYLGGTRVWQAHQLGLWLPPDSTAPHPCDSNEWARGQTLTVGLSPDSPKHT